MDKWVEVILGLISLTVAALIWSCTGRVALDFLIGGFIWILVMIGILFVVLGIGEIMAKKESAD